MTVWPGLSPSGLQAAIFDMDGVLTDSAQVHARAWKTLFDEFLLRTFHGAEPEFDLTSDYPQWVDGRPRYEGVASFLASRGIVLPQGSPSDGDGEATVYGLGNRKNRIFHHLVEESGIEVFSDSLRLLGDLTGRGIPVGLVTSSRNRETILRAAGLAGRFDEEVDGQEVEAQGLRGKPAPDAFVYCARRLGVTPDRCAVLEDAVSGVQAAKAGGFGLVLGLARHGELDVLRGAGADVVCADLESVDLRTLQSWWADMSKAGRRKP